MKNGPYTITLSMDEVQDVLTGLAMHSESCEFTASQKAVDRLRDKFRELYQDLTFTREIPSYGDLMTREQYLSNCRNHFFVDYDGHGNASDGKMMSDYVTHPSTADQLPPEATHVVWYNK